MKNRLFEEALGYAKKNIPGYVKIDKTFENALRCYLTNKTEITETAIKNWIEASYK